MGKRMILFGDSITKGIVWDEDEKKYTVAERCFANRLAETGLDIVNKAKMGSTITKGMRTIIRTIESEPPYDYAMICFGGNDSDYKWPEISADPGAVHKPLTFLEDYVDIYIEAVERIKAWGAIPVVLNLPPIHSIKYFKWFIREGLNGDNIMNWLVDVELIYRHHEMYSVKSAEVAIKTGARFIDIRTPFIGRPDCGGHICIDGIHVNQKGHDLISDILLRNLKNELTK